MRVSQNIAPPDAVKRVIHSLKEAKTNEGRIIVRITRKTEEFLGKIGWKEIHIKQELSELTLKNYSNGPENNQGNSGTKKGQIWVFGRKIKNFNVYIKLHLVPLEGKETRFVCISFHEEEADAKKLKFPYIDYQD
ncbi:hypothetical protein [Bacillus sp. 005/A4HT-01/001]|uniref:hypothetical protein n=1 Tax=Bacillus sp. 005/A4HT-01/001 TaxID=2509010 RepID=UPI00107582C3|nr:hypothetical protein [Bacillus sp. 005/A4HT-01/001]TFW48020.1 hypothetical protein ES896_06765 [Bacillus sp. 005/A4HT-01/001]